MFEARIAKLNTDFLQPTSYKINTLARMLVGGS